MIAPRVLEGRPGAAVVAACRAHLALATLRAELRQWTDEAYDGLRRFVEAAR